MRASSKPQRIAAANHDLAAAISFRPPAVRGERPPIIAGPRQRTAFLKVAAWPAEVVSIPRQSRGLYGVNRSKR